MAGEYDWIGPLIGAVGGYLGSQNNPPQQSTQQSVPPELQQLLAGISQRGMELGNMPYQPYQGQQVADFSPYQFQGMDRISQAAQGQQPMLQAGQNNLTDTLSGKYLGGANPYLDQMVNQTNHDIMGQINGGAFSSGSFGNAGVAQAGAQGLANSENQLRYGAYNDERNRQMQAQGLLPSTAAAQYMPGQQLMNIGSIQQQQGQNLINANMNQYQQAMQWPFQTYNAMLAPFGKNVGGQSTTYGAPSNPVAGMLGGAMLGGQLGSAWGGGGSGGQPNQFSGWGTGSTGQYPGSDQWGTGY